MCEDYDDRVRWHYWDCKLDKARREGTIAGLEIALVLAESDTQPRAAIRAEIERLRADVTTADSSAAPTRP